VERVTEPEDTTPNAPTKSQKRRKREEGGTSAFKAYGEAVDEEEKKESDAAKPSLKKPMVKKTPKGKVKKAETKESPDSGMRTRSGLSVSPGKATRSKAFKTPEAGPEMTAQKPTSVFSGLTSTGKLKKSPKK
jgi:hypothetical protein